MEHIQFGAFIAQLRKEHQMTQRELAGLLHVTDKAVSKWETGKGFPDLKLLEPLAQALDVSLVELLQGTRNPSPTLTKEEAGQAAVRAMRQSERATARRYLRLFRWLLTGILVLCLLFLLPHAVLACWHLYDRLVVAPKAGGNRKRRHDHRHRDRLHCLPLLVLAPPAPAGGGGPGGPRSVHPGAAAGEAVEGPGA